MAKPGVEILDAGPRARGARSPIMPVMKSTSPIRRYVLLRQPGASASVSRWSMERVAPAPGTGACAPAVGSPAKLAGGRG